MMLGAGKGTSATANNRCRHPSNGRDGEGRLTVVVDLWGPTISRDATPVYWRGDEVFFFVNQQKENY
jgi:hypothetical protein